MENQYIGSVAVHDVHTWLLRAWDSIQPQLRPTLSAEESRSLLRPRQAGAALILRAITVCETNVHLLPPHLSPREARERWESLQAMRILSGSADAFAGQLADTIRQVECELYKMAMTAYAVAELTGGDVHALAFREEMKRALANGPRRSFTRANTGSDPDSGEAE